MVRLRAVARPPFAPALRTVVRPLVVLLRRVPVERAFAVVERRRVPPVAREREVDAFFRAPVLRARLVVERLRPRLDAARTREIRSSGCRGCSSGC